MSRSNIFAALVGLAVVTWPILCGQAASAQDADKAFDSQAWQKAQKTGQRAVETSDYGLAERSFNQALEEARKLPAPANERKMAESMTGLANLYVIRGQNAKAEPLYEKVLKIKQAVSAPLDKDLLRLKAKVIQFYLGQNKKDKALKLVDEIAMASEVEVKQFIDLVQAFNRLQGFYHANRKLEEAEIQVKQAQDSTIAFLKDNAQEDAVLFDNLAGNIKDLSQPQATKLAERLYKSALALRERSLPSEHAALSASMENLGRLYLKENHLAQAELLLSKSYEMSLKTLGQERRETQVKLDGLAQALIAQGHLARAEAQYRKLFAQDPKTFKPGPDILAQFAALLVRQGKNQEATNYYARALKMQEAAYGPNHASLVNLLEAFSLALSKANRPQEAQKMAARAKAIKS